MRSSLVQKHRAILLASVEILMNHWKVVAGRRFFLWKFISRKISKRLSKAAAALFRLLKARTELNLSAAFASVNRYSQQILATIEKVEKKYGLRHHSLLRNILTLSSSREAPEKISTTPAPTRLNQKTVMRKNGYRYLSLLLRKFVWKRELALFGWYQQHTKMIRNAFYLGDLVSRMLKIKG